MTPFRIAANLYYVGASDVTSFLITTPDGHVLLDGGYAETAPQIEKNIEALGFRLGEVKILLNSHAHFDHAGGLADLKRATGAKLYAMAADADLLEHGGAGDFFFGDTLRFPPVAVDRRLADGDGVALGGQRLVAHLTAGHTRGCTTWTAEIGPPGSPLRAVFVGSATVLPGYRLAGKESYPGIAADYARTFATLAGLPCDLFLGSHGSFFDLERKRIMAERGMGMRNPFIDPPGYQAYVAEAKKAFLAARAAESAPAGPP